MYAGVSSTGNTATNVATLDNDNSSDIPEWKRLLIMKKRAGSNLNADEHNRRNPDTVIGNVNITRNGDSSICDNFSSGCNKFSRSAKAVEQDLREISPPKTVTIGNINVELRCVKSSENVELSTDSSKLDRTSNSDFNVAESEDDGCEDLEYGPGIVDRLRARFLNMGAKKPRKPVVRRFSSLENLPGSNAGPYRVNARGIRQNGFKVGSGNYYGSGNVKKAQSMETLICSAPEQPIFSVSRRPNSRYVGGVKARILAKNISPITMFTDENDEPNEKSPSPASSPRLFTKSIRRWDYNRSASAPNINEDELPKPDTVKHVKKMFESPVIVNSSEKSSSQSVAVRFRKIPGTTTTPTSLSNNGAILGSARPVVKKLDLTEDSPDAKTSSAKESPDLSVVNIPPKKEELLSPTRIEEECDDYKINKRGYSPVLDDNLSAIRSCDTPLEQEDTVLLSSDDAHNLLIHSPENTDTGKEEFDDFNSPEELSVKVTPEQLPLEGYKHSEVLSQGSRVVQISGAELLEDEDLSLPHPQPGVVSPDEGMVVAAAAASDSFPAPKKGANWQKAPPATTSIVFDFRGKDVKPNISLSPTPFGCRPAKVSRNSSAQKKRSGSPPRSGVNGVGSKDYEEEDQPNGDEDDEDWDEMDIGADLPAISGIVFTGENVKVGRGAFLETRNKKLTLQFDDRATSTFEYPSENTSPSPMEENGSFTDSSFDPSIAIGSAANSRLGLSNYTPQVLSSSSNNFELGISQPKHRPNLPSPEKSEVTDDVPTLDVIIPAKPEDTGGWSATESADILF